MERYIKSRRPGRLYYFNALYGDWAGTESLALYSLITLAGSRILLRARNKIPLLPADFEGFETNCSVCGLVRPLDAICSQGIRARNAGAGEEGV